MCSCDNLNRNYCSVHRAEKEARDRLKDFKSTDLAFFIERLQIVLDVISMDNEDLAGIEDAQYHAQSLWDLARLGQRTEALRTLEWFHGYIWAVPESHIWSFRHMVASVRRAL